VSKGPFESIDRSIPEESLSSRKYEIAAIYLNWRNHCLILKRKSLINDVINLSFLIVRLFYR